MVSPFVSLNSWTHPGLLHQAWDPVEILEGGPSEWGRLREALARHRQNSPDAVHPRGAAVGWFTYEGNYWFGFFPRIRVVPNDVPNTAWQIRRTFRQPPEPGPDWRSNFSRAQFEAAVRKAQEYIRAGDLYQVNLAQRFETPFSGDPYGLFEQLAWRSPAPGSAFLDTGGTQVLSASPELFLVIEGGRMVTRPIKGTRPRSRDPLRDAQLGFELQTSPKELAELVMITDLERNDLGRVCEYGSVVVTDLCRLEKYAQVYHLVSTIEGRLRKGIDAIDALEACFPGGSITGAPKRRSMEIIAELEPARRGIYTGAIGYFGFNGDAAFSVAIRTLVLENEMLTCFAGSGITADSDPASEYEETLHKASGMRLAVQEYYRGVGAEVRPAVSHPV
jgi:aminodeoxychorismate synthase component I